MGTVNPEETKVELITVGIVLIILAFFLFGGLRDSLAMLVAGLVLLGSGVYQTQQGWHVSLVTWLLGIVLTLAGLGLRLYLVGVMRVNFVGITLLALGGYVLYSAFRRQE
ncbi:MAG: hypothetical protein AAFV33_04735 [Chloroflexota bacterium]